jgi:hypothetical protein
MLVLENTGIVMPRSIAKLQPKGWMEEAELFNVQLFLHTIDRYLIFEILWVP